MFSQPLDVHGIFCLAIACLTIYITSKIEIVMLESTCSIFIFYSKRRVIIF